MKDGVKICVSKFIAMIIKVIIMIISKAKRRDKEFVDWKKNFKIIKTRNSADWSKMKILRGKTNSL